MAETQALPPLTAVQKNEIRAEELFRRQVAKEIAADDDKGTSVWSVLNSSFALWFLSSVVVSGLTAAVALYQKKHAEDRRRIDLQTRLATEISFRIDNGLIAMHLDEKRVDAGNIYTQGAVYGEALAYLDNRMYSGTQLLDFSIHQDYKTRRFLSLIFELRSAVEPTLRLGLQEAGAEYTAIEALADHAAIQSPVADKANTLSAVAQSITHLEKLRDCGVWENLS